MPKTITTISGDGVIDPYVAYALTLPDAGSAIALTGAVRAIGGSQVLLSPSSLTAPTLPGSGSIFWEIEVNVTTGVAQVIQSTSQLPAPDPGNVIIFQDQMSPTDTVLSNDAYADTTDQW